MSKDPCERCGGSGEWRPTSEMLKHISAQPVIDTTCPNGCVNTDPPAFRCSMCDAVLRPEGWRRRWATCDVRTGCGLLSTHYGTDRRPSRSRWTVMWVAWITGLLTDENEWDAS